MKFKKFLCFQSILFLGLALPLKGEIQKSEENNYEIRNFISDPGFEMPRILLGHKWNPVGKEYSLDKNEKRSGVQSLKLIAGSATFTCLVPSEMKYPCSFIISGWSKCKNISGTEAKNYSINADISFADGSRSVESAAFNTGSHSWEYTSVVFNLEKPVKGISISLVSTLDGVAWVDDIYAGIYRKDMEKYEGCPYVFNILESLKPLEKNLTLLKEKAEILDSLLKKAENNGADAASLKISLTIARLFIAVIPDDIDLASLDTKDYPAFDDFGILGFDEVCKRIKNLPFFESTEIERILDASIKEAKTLVDEKRGNVQGNTDYRIVKDLTVKDGALYQGERAVFMTGVYHEFWCKKKWMTLNNLKGLGANLVSRQIGGVAMDTAFKGWDNFDPKCFEEQVFPYCKTAEGNGFWVVLSIWRHKAVPWLSELDVEKGKGWWIDIIDADNPLSEKYVREFFRHAASQVKKVPNTFCYSLMGEEHSNAAFIGKFTMGRYEKWLNDRHGSIENLNKAWKTAYGNFKEAAEQKNRTGGAEYDWYVFNQNRLVSFNQWQIDAIKAEDANASRITCWPVAGYLSNPPGGRARRGINWEDLINQESVVGWDGALLPREAKEAKRYWEKTYNSYSMAWQDEMIYYDLAKSIAPGKPIFDPEWHCATSVRHISPLGTSGDFLRTSLWMQHLHGLSAHLLWWWPRRDDGSISTVEFLGSMGTQPQLLEAWAKTMLELRTLSKYIVLFPQLERKVKILHSNASAIWQPEKNVNSVSDMYEALYFLDYPVGFITEKMIQEGSLRDCSLLIIPNAEYVNEETFRKISEYARNGGTVAVKGETSLKYDEYGHERNTKDFSNLVEYIKGDTNEECSVQLDKLMEKSGIGRQLRLLDKNGKSFQGVEMRAANMDGKKILYLINLKLNEVEISLKTKDKGIDKHIRNLITNEDLRINGTLKLEPRKPMLLEVY